MCAAVGRLGELRARRGGGQSRRLAGDLETLEQGSDLRRKVGFFGVREAATFTWFGLVTMSLATLHFPTVRPYFLSLVEPLILLFVAPRLCVVVIASALPCSTKQL